MSLPNYDLLEDIFEGEEYEKEDVFREDGTKPKFKQLRDRGLINVNATFIGDETLFDSVEITEFGIDVLLDERRHKDNRAGNLLLTMVTCLYTAGTGALVMANSSSLFLMVIGGVLIATGMSAFFIIGLRQRVVNFKERISE